VLRGSHVLDLKGNRSERGQARPEPRGKGNK
jgi:hypothetical protein